MYHPTGDSIIPPSEGWLQYRTEMKRRLASSDRQMTQDDIDSQIETMWLGAGDDVRINYERQAAIGPQVPNFEASNRSPNYGLSSIPEEIPSTPWRNNQPLPSVYAYSPLRHAPRTAPSPEILPFVATPPRQPFSTLPPTWEGYLQMIQGSENGGLPPQGFPQQNSPQNQSPSHAMKDGDLPTPPRVGTPPNVRPGALDPPAQPFPQQNVPMWQSPSDAMKGGEPVIPPLPETVTGGLPGPFGSPPWQRNNTPAYNPWASNSPWGGLNYPQNPGGGSMPGSMPYASEYHAQQVPAFSGYTPVRYPQPSPMPLNYAPGRYPVPGGISSASVGFGSVPAPGGMPRPQTGVTRQGTPQPGGIGSPPWVGAGAHPSRVGTPVPTLNANANPDDWAWKAETAPPFNSPRGNESVRPPLRPDQRWEVAPVPHTTNETHPKNESITFSNLDEPGSKIWQPYLNLAEKYDKTVVEGWRDDMDALLIFAALFSASVTTFVVDSYKYLQADPADLTLSVLLQISRQLAPGNQTNVAVLQSFSPPHSFIVVNILWFLSLVFSLSCALFAVLVKQWARNYLRGAQNNPSVSQRARMRQLLYEKMVSWKLEVVVEMIPALLHISLILFFVGLLQFLFVIHRTLAIYALSFLSLAGITYALLTISPLFFPGCPYKTPFSRSPSLVFHAVKVPSVSAAKLIKASLMYGTDRFRLPLWARERLTQTIAMLQDVFQDAWHTLWGVSLVCRTLRYVRSILISYTGRMIEDLTPLPEQDTNALRWAIKSSNSGSDLLTIVDAIPDYIKSLSIPEAHGVNVGKGLYNAQSRLWSTGVDRLVIQLLHSCLDRKVINPTHLRVAQSCIAALHWLSRCPATFFWDNDDSGPRTTLLTSKNLERNTPLLQIDFTIDYPNTTALAWRRTVSNLVLDQIYQVEKILRCFFDSRLPAVEYQQATALLSLADQSAAVLRWTTVTGVETVSIKRLSDLLDTIPTLLSDNLPGFISYGSTIAKFQKFRTKWAVWMLNHAIPPPPDFIDISLHDSLLFNNLCDAATHLQYSPLATRDSQLAMFRLLDNVLRSNERAQHRDFFAVKVPDALLASYARVLFGRQMHFDDNYQNRTKIHALFFSRVKVKGGKSHRFHLSSEDVQMNIRDCTQVLDRLVHSLERLPPLETIPSPNHAQEDFCALAIDAILSRRLLNAADYDGRVEINMQHLSAAQKILSWIQLNRENDATSALAKLLKTTAEQFAYNSDLMIAFTPPATPSEAQTPTDDQNDPNPDSVFVPPWPRSPHISPVQIVEDISIEERSASPADSMIPSPLLVPPVPSSSPSRNTLELKEDSEPSILPHSPPTDDIDSASAGRDSPRSKNQSPVEIAQEGRSHRSSVQSGGHGTETSPILGTHPHTISLVPPPSQLSISSVQPSLVASLESIPGSSPPSPQRPAHQDGNTDAVGGEASQQVPQPEANTEDGILAPTPSLNDLDEHLDNTVHSSLRTEFLPGRSYGPVLDPFHIETLGIIPKLNSLLAAPHEEHEEHSGDRLEWTMSFPTSMVHRVSDPPHTSWTRGRTSPATFPRISNMRICLHDSPWVTNVVASDQEVGVTCSDIIEALKASLNKPIMPEEFLNFSTDVQRRLSATYHRVHGSWNRTTPGLMRVDWFGNDPQFSGLERDQDYVFRVFGVTSFCVWVVRPVEKDREIESFLADKPGKNDTTGQIQATETGDDRNMAETHPTSAEKLDQAATLRLFGLSTNSLKEELDETSFDRNLRIAEWEASITNS